MTSPYVHGLFTIVLIKQIVEKKVHQGQHPEIRQFKPEMNPDLFITVQKPVIVECKFYKCLVFALWKTRAEKFNFLMTMLRNTSFPSSEIKKFQDFIDLII